jgi:hypothetical protein
MVLPVLVRVSARPPPTSILGAGERACHISPEISDCMLMTHRISDLYLRSLLILTMMDPSSHMWL